MADTVSQCLSTSNFRVHVLAVSSCIDKGEVPPAKNRSSGMAGLCALRLPSVILMYCLPCLDFVALLLHAPTLQARYSWMLLSTMFRFRFCSCMLRCPLCRLNVPRGPNSRLPELPTMQPAPYLSEKSQLGNGVLCTLLEHVAVVKSECESAPATKSGRPLCFERFYALVEELPPVGYSV